MRWLTFLWFNLLYAFKQRIMWKGIMKILYKIFRSLLNKYTCSCKNIKLYLEPDFCRDYLPFHCFPFLKELMYFFFLCLPEYMLLSNYIFKWLKIHKYINFSHSGSVNGFWIIFYDSGKAKVWHFTNKVAVDKNIACCKIPVYISHIGQISHSSSNSPQHSHQLNDCKLPIMFLEGKKNGNSY